MKSTVFVILFFGLCLVVGLNIAKKTMTLLDQDYITQVVQTHEDLIPSDYQIVNWVSEHVVLLKNSDEQEKYFLFVERFDEILVYELTFAARQCSLLKHRAAGVGSCDKFLSHPEIMEVMDHYLESLIPERYRSNAPTSQSAIAH